MGSTPTERTLEGERVRDNRRQTKGTTLKKDTNTDSSEEAKKKRAMQQKTGRKKKKKKRKKKAVFFMSVTFEYSIIHYGKLTVLIGNDLPEFGTNLITSLTTWVRNKQFVRS